MHSVTISAQDQVLAATGGGHRAARFLERSTTIGRMGASAVRAGTIDRAGFRPELNGLRGLAIALVVVYHVFFGRVSGGVDIFLMISAFLLTGSFVNRIDAGRPLGITGYWLRVFKRLLPPAAIVIAASLAMLQPVFAPERWRIILDEALASLTYTQNWLLAYSAVDYYAPDRSQASPFQHFWSLSIQGQVFVVWPLLILLGLGLAKLIGRSVRTALGLVFGLVLAASLGFSIWATAENQTFAYFDSFTRAWEFAFGSLLGLALPLLERRFGYGPQVAAERGRGRGLRVLLGWAGIIAMLALGLVVDVAGLFPGYIALWPLAAAAAVIIAGRTGVPWSADRWLATPPMQWLGEISYAFYLVHWPLLVAWLTLRERPQAEPLEGLGLIAASLVLAAALTRLVDQPIRRSAWLAASSRRQLATIGLALLVGLVPILDTELRFERHRQHLAAESLRNNPGAAVLTGAELEAADEDAPALPLPQDLPYDFTNYDTACDPDLLPAAGPLAAHCAAVSWGDPDKLIVAIGSSRTQQWSAALLPLAQAHDYHVVALMFPGCPFGSRNADACGEWNDLLIDHLVELKPRAVFTSTTQIIPLGREAILPGTRAAIARLTAAGIDVIGMRDQPRLPSRSACQQTPPRAACTFDTKTIYQPRDINAGPLAAERAPGRLLAIDLVGWICPDDRCRPIIGNVHVYLDINHLSATYAATMAPMLDAELQAAGWRW